MREETVKVYTFEELSERAKEKAREWYRHSSCDDSFWSEYVIEQAAEAGKMLGIDLNQKPVKLYGGGTRMEPLIYWSGFCSQGDGACYECTYSYAKGSTKAILKEWPRDEELPSIARRLTAVQKKYFYKLSATTKHRGRYYHEHSMDIEVVEEEYRKIDPDDIEEVKDCLRDFARWIYRALEREYDYQNSDEAVDDTIRANEYEFTADGESYL